MFWLVSYRPGDFPTAVIAWLLSWAEVQLVAFAAIFCEVDMPHRNLLLCYIVLQSSCTSPETTFSELLEFTDSLSLVDMQIPVTACGVWEMKSSPGSQAHQRRVRQEDCRILALVAMDRQNVSTGRKNRHCFKQKCKISLCSEEHFNKVLLHCTLLPFLFVSYVKFTELWLVKYFITMHFVQ